MLLDALAGVDAVIHLAAQNPYPDASWEDASASFDMTAKLVDTCAKASVSRLVFASSNHVMRGYRDTPVAPSDGGLSTDLPPLVGTRVGTSEGLIDSTAYAAAKLMGERVVAAQAEAGAFSAISLRIGWRQPGENIPQTISAAGTPKSGLFETDPKREHDLRWFRAALERRPHPVRSCRPARSSLRMAISGHRRERDVRESTFALGLIGSPQADRLLAARRCIEIRGSGPALRPKA
jgi:hypothetical protein